MEMGVVDAAERFAGQTRRVVVVDIAVRRVEEIEHVEVDSHAGRELVAGLEVHQRRGPGPNRIVLDQRARSEKARANAAEHIVEAVNSDASRKRRLDRAGYVIAGGILVGEMRLRP